MLARIEQLLPDLSPAEARVGRWLLDHPRQCLEAPLAEVAAAAGTSEPTVVRFCRRLGLGGFRELRIRLAESLGRPADYVHRGVLPDDSAADAVAKVIDSAVQTLMTLRDGIGMMPIAEIVEAMADARQIVFAGLGLCGPGCAAEILPPRHTLQRGDGRTDHPAERRHRRPTGSLRADLPQRRPAGARPRGAPVP